MDEKFLRMAVYLVFISGHLGLDPQNSRLRDIPFFHYMIHWAYSAIEPLILKMCDILLTNRTLTKTGWGMKILKSFAVTCRPLPHGIVVTTEAAHNVVDYLDSLDDEQKGFFAIGPCLCQASMNKYEGPLMKDIQFLYARDMFLSLKMGHRPANAAEVKEVLNSCRDFGYIHNLEMCMQSGKWVFCICNCEPRICAPTRIFMQTGNLLYHGPEVCRVSVGQCLGIHSCGECLKQCMFSAIPINEEYAGIDPEKCLGCGLCVSTCPTDAREMIPRSDYRYNHLVPAEILLPSHYPSMGGEHREALFRN